MLTFVREHYRFAIVGFAITALSVVWQLATDPFSGTQGQNVLMVMFLVLCPPSIISIPIIDAEVGTSGFYFLWTIIALLNAAFYAVIAAGVIHLRKRRS